MNHNSLAGLLLRRRFRATISVLIVVSFLINVGCSRQAPSSVSSLDTTTSETESGFDPDPPSATNPAVLPGIVRWETVLPLRHDVAIMDSVFWEPADTDSLRALIFKSPDIKDSRVLEIGTGSGLVSLCCLQAGAAHVVATDLNPNAVQNVRFNAANFASSEQLDARLVPRRNPNAWTVIRPEEKFDFILSNPPWENQNPKSVAEFALYDPDFLLLDSLVKGARDRLKSSGRMWLAYGCVTAIRRIETLANAEELHYTQLDERDLDDLPEVFLPGMLLELTVGSGSSERHED